jgi:hypothetical protein
LYSFQNRIRLFHSWRAKRNPSAVAPEMKRSGCIQTGSWVSFFQRAKISALFLYFLSSAEGDIRWARRAGIRTVSDEMTGGSIGDRSKEHQ